jgi:hypothetical protein
MKTMVTQKSNIFIVAIVSILASGCVLLEDGVKVSQYELRRQHTEKYYGNDKDEDFKKSMSREAAFDSISRVRNPERSSAPRPVEPPHL